MTGKYLIVTDYFDFIKNEDLSDILQRIIDENPNRTIFFPDGEYVISKPLKTSALPSKSVSLVLSNYAIIKASEDWNHEDAMICIGGKEQSNDNYSIGSNYGIEGGIIDGSGRVTGISIDSGRESFIRNISIKNTKTAIHIKYGANSGSSDAELMGINIVGTGEADSIGILVDGFDNTITNVRMSKIFIGVKLNSSGNILRSIHPLYIYGNEETDENYSKSTGFIDLQGNNFYDFCYSDQFATGFYTGENVFSTYHNCWCFWYSERGDFHRGFCVEGAFDSLVTNFKIGFKKEQKQNIVLSEKKSGGCGVFEHLCVEENMITDNTYKKYICG